MSPLAVQSTDAEWHREKHYNATVVQVRRVTDGLMVLRVRPDEEREFLAGQYTVLGLGNWEPRIPEALPETDGQGDEDKFRLVRRAYSISSPIFAEDGGLTRSGEGGVLEFYIALVQNPDHPAALTPRLFMLKEGDRLHVGPHCRGRYTLERLTDANQGVVLIATGCGEAPHNAMISELLQGEYTGPIVSVVCTRQLADLAYLDKHRLLEQEFERYTYLTLTTREPCNLDRSHPCYVGKQYVQDYFASGAMEADAGMVFQSASTHVFLCGSPDMIGLPVHTRGEPDHYPTPVGMVELLEKRGFRLDRAGEAGNIHVESYW